MQHGEVEITRLVRDLRKLQAMRRRIDQCAVLDQAAPARSDTRTSGFRGAPDSASRLRRRSPRTKALAETMRTSRFRLTVTSQRVVGPHAIATAAPFDAAAVKARNKYDKRQDIANGTKPELTLRDIPTIAQLEQAMQLGLQSETAGQRRRDDHCGWGEPAEQEADQGKRHGKGNGEAGKTERIHGADGPCPANVVQQQFAQGLLGADMGDDE